MLVIKSVKGQIMPPTFNSKGAAAAPIGGYQQMTNSWPGMRPFIFADDGAFYLSRFSDLFAVDRDGTWAHGCWIENPSGTAQWIETGRSHWGL